MLTERSQHETGEDPIWRLANALSGAATPYDVATAVAQEGAFVAGASFSNVALLDAETQRVRAVHQSGIDTAVAARWEEFDLNASTPLGEAMRTRSAVLIESAERLGEHYPHLVADTVAASLSATASLPLATTRDVVLGAVGFGWSDAQTFSPELRRRLELIANLATLALERAVLSERQHEQASSRGRSNALLLQEAFLPKALPHTATLDVAALYLPADAAAVGGDWYDVFPVDGGTCLVVGDVAGHGLGSAAVMGQLRNTVRAYAVQDSSPASVLTRLNQMMCRLEPGEYASAVVAVWDERHGTLLRSNAGHPPVLRCRVGEFDYLVPPPGRLLGVTPDWEYEEESKVLRPGTTMLFYTDGLVELRNQTIDAGMADLKAFIEQLDDLSPQVVCDRVRQWRRRIAGQEDDVCVLAARLRPSV